MTFRVDSTTGYTLNIRNPHHWLISTRKLVDPRWEAPRGAALSLEIETTHANNILSVELKTDTWRSYTGRKAETWSALVSLNKTGRQKVELSTRDFTNASGESMSDWYGITELIFQAGAKIQTLSHAHPAVGGWRFLNSMTCAGWMANPYEDPSLSCPWTQRLAILMSHESLAAIDPILRR